MYKYIDRTKYKTLTKCIIIIWSQCYFFIKGPPNFCQLIRLFGLKLVKNSTFYYLILRRCTTVFLMANMCGDTLWYLKYWVSNSLKPTYAYILWRIFFNSKGSKNIFKTEFPLFSLLWKLSSSTIYTTYWNVLARLVVVGIFSFFV